MKATSLSPQPLDFLRLLAHSLRWRLLLALARSDHRVSELVARLKQPPNLVSYHLRRLRNLQLVAERRSSADRRDIYYSLNLERLRQLYAASAEELHPGLSLSEPAPQTQRVGGSSRPTRVLFLCTHNSARSQMAEGLLRHLSGGQVEVFSAGNQPATIHPLAIKVMQQRGIDISQQRSKLLDEFIGQSFDYIVTVCDRARESCPVFPGAPEHIHWSFPDPAAVTGSEKTRLRAFEDIARQLTTRLNFLLILDQRS